MIGMHPHQELEYVWAKTSQGLYIVVFEDNSQVYIESPAEQSLRADFDDITGGLVRVFVTEEDAVTYLDLLQIYTDEPLAIAQVDKLQLMDFAQKVAATKQIRFDLSLTDPADWPRSVDVFWGTGFMIN